MLANYSSTMCRSTGNSILLKNSIFKVFSFVRSIEIRAGHVPIVSVASILQFLQKSVPLVIPIPFHTANQNTHVLAANHQFLRVVLNCQATFYNLKVCWQRKSKFTDQWVGLCKLWKRLKTVKSDIFSTKNVIFKRFQPLSKFHFPACTTLPMSNWQQIRKLRTKHV